jgi:hypothetical protein
VHRLPILGLAWIATLDDGVGGAQAAKDRRKIA